MTDKLQRITVQQWEDVRKDIRDLKHEDASLDRRVDANEDDIRIWGSRVEQLKTTQQRFERTNDGQYTIRVELKKYNKLINAVKLILLEGKAHPAQGCTPGGLEMVREALADMDKE